MFNAFGRLSDGQVPTSCLYSVDHVFSVHLSIYLATFTQFDPNRRQSEHTVQCSTVQYSVVYDAQT